MDQPFIKNAGQQSQTYKRLQEVERINMGKDYKVKSLEDKVGYLEDEINKTNDLLAKTQAERDLSRKELQQLRQQLHKSGLEMEDVQKLLNFHDPSHFREVMSSLKLDGKGTDWFMTDLSGNDPQSQERDLNLEADPQKLRNYIRKIKSDKIQLATALQKAQTLLNIQSQMEKESLKLYQNQIKQLKLQLRARNQKIEQLALLADSRQNKLAKVGNIQNSMILDSVSEFSHDDDGMSTVVGSGQNVIDLLLGNADYDILSMQTCLKKFDGLQLDIYGQEQPIDKSTGMPALPSFQTFLTIDFYNHEPYTSTILEGAAPGFNFQISYKNQIDAHYIKTLQTRMIRIEVYLLKNQKTYKIGYGDISMMQLLKIAENHNALVQNNGRKNILPCVKDRKVVIYYCNSEPARPVKIGSVQYKIRLRYPMQEALRMYKQEEMVQKHLFKTAAQRQQALRKIQESQPIDKMAYPKRGVSLSLIQFAIAQNTDLINPFVYYKFYNCDEYYSATFQSGEVNLNDTNRFYVLEDQGFKNYLSKEQLEIVFFDQLVPLRNKTRLTLSSNRAMPRQPKSDVIGIAKLPLHQLLTGKRQLTQNVNITTLNDSSNTIGQISVRLYIFDPQSPEYRAAAGTDVATHPAHLKVWQEQILLKLALSIKARRLSYDNIFLLFDTKQDGIIDAQEFSTGLIKDLKFDISEQNLDKFIEQSDLFKQRLTKPKFIKFLKDIESKFPQRFSHRRLYQKDQDIALNSSLGLSANNPMFRGIIDPLIQIMIQNNVSHQNFRKIILNYDRSGHGYVTSEQLQEIFTGLSVPIDKGQFHQLAQILENKRTHKIEYLSILQIFKLHQKQNLQLNAIQQEENQNGERPSFFRGSGAGGPFDQSISHSMNQQLGSGADEYRIKSKVAESKIQQVLIKQNSLMKKIFEDRKISDQEQISANGIDAFLKDSLGLKLKQIEIQALYKKFCILYGSRAGGN